MSKQYKRKKIWQHIFKLGSKAAYEVTINKLLVDEVLSGLIVVPANPPLNDPPVWDSQPNIQFEFGTSSSYDMNDISSDPNGDTITFTMNTGTAALPTGTTWTAATGVLSYNGIGAIDNTTGHIITLNDGTDTTDSDSFAIDISDVITVIANGTGDYTTINAALAAITTGETIEIRANTPGGSQIFTENVLLDNTTANGTNGNECILRGRSGDTIAIYGTGLGTNRRFNIQNTLYWKFQNISQIGENMWTISRPPGDNSGQYESRYGLFIEDSSQYLTFEDIGDITQGNDNKIWGANNFSANMVGRFGSEDGCSHVKFKNCHFELHGDNNSLIPGNMDWGDLFRMSVPNFVLEDCTFNKGGHNSLSVEEGPGIIRNCISDQDWRIHNTGEDGYRAAEISYDKTNLPLIHVGSVLVEGCIFRNAYDGGSPNAQAGAKWQARRGVFRYNTMVTTRAIGIKNDRNAGIDGTVTQSKFYHNTLWDCQSIMRTVENTTGFVDIHVEHSYVNMLVQNLGPGDQADLDTYIYMEDQSIDQAGYSDGWKGDEWRGMTVDTTGLTFEVRYRENGGSTTRYSLANAISTFPAVFSNWDEDVVTFSNTTNAASSWNYATAYAGLTTTNSPASLTDVEDLTTMVGSGSSATSGTFADGRFFILADTDFDLSYFGEQNDQVDIGGSVVRLVTLNKNTGAATWDTPITWSNGAGVNHAPGGVIPTQRGAVQ